eukprot:TRINITY_DN17514_c0_g1_i1.p1 TRINITY_DN17514_c0_g1~~TRINITY_DN17514_c0_g1_i1.p1  ORF type:complete len:156 (+),score=28.15 TRINITY_DN17514_c0_g1_i1:51-518(+)
MEYFRNPFQPRQEQSFIDEMKAEMGLSFTKRIMIFAGLLGVGILFCFLSTMMVLSPTKFAKFYTIGTMFIIASTMVLVGPKRQVQSMCDPSRLASAVIYFGSVGFTLFAALSLGSVILTLIAIIVQFCAAIWYGASYIPFAQNCLRSTATTVLPL